MAADHHRCADAAANGNGDEHVGQGIGGAYGGQRILTDELPNDHRVRHGIKLLKKVAQDHGDGEHQQCPGRLTLNEIFLFPYGMVRGCSSVEVPLLLLVVAAPEPEPWRAVTHRMTQRDCQGPAADRSISHERGKP